MMTFLIALLAWGLGVGIIAAFMIDHILDTKRKISDSEIIVGGLLIIWPLTTLPLLMFWVTRKAIQWWKDRKQKKTTKCKRNC